METKVFTKIAETAVKEAIKTILCDYDAYSKSLNYAVNYCREALKLEGEDLRVQCLYILNNIPYWRGNGSKEVRKTLKEFVKRGGDEKCQK